MATFKAEVYAHQKRSDGTWNIKIRVIHKKKKKYLATPYYVYKDDLTRTLKLKNQHYIDECSIIIKKYRSICEQLGDSINEMDVCQVVDYIKRKSKKEAFDLDIIAYGKKIVHKLKATGHSGNAKTYENAIRNLIKFVGREEISINEITSRFVKEWIEWIQERPAETNGKKKTRAQSLYPSNLRAIHNRAKDEFNDEDTGVINIPLSPFSKVKLPKVKNSRKRALEPGQIKKLSALPYTLILQPGNNRFNLAKDLYLLSFALIGMNAIDLYYCTEYKNGRITYERIKTRNRRADHAEISIKVQPEIKGLMEKYKDPDGKRVFDFYHHYSSVGAFTAALNKGLKKIGVVLGIDDLEFYSARHSWATIAVNNVGINKYTVHTALNHVDEKMKITDTYIKRSWKPIDKANRKVLNFIDFKIGNIEEPKSDKYREKHKD